MVATGEKKREGREKKREGSKNARKKKQRERKKLHNILLILLKMHVIFTTLSIF